MKMEIVRYGNKDRIEKIIDRSALNFGDALDTASNIIGEVRKRGDTALVEYAKKFDRFDLNGRNIRINENEIKTAYKNVDKAYIAAIKNAYKNIKKFHSAQFARIKKEWGIRVIEGVSITERILPIESAAVYVPGGRAEYPSTVLMGSIPASVAGVKRIVLLSPPPIPPSVLVAADICGVREIYGIGGAQAIAAAAYGTESIKPVDKIVGPGNIFVTAAKMLVFGKVGIDMPAGPSEVMIIADKDANPGFIAADILAQAEHDPLASCILVTPSEKLAEKVLDEIGRMKKRESRIKTIDSALGHAYIIITDNLNDTVDFANMYAPEHLEIMTKKHIEKKIRNAGTIFVGGFAPVACGDYASGSNHVLPTSGTAKFSSGLSVRDFIKTMSVQNVDMHGLKKLKKTVETIAKKEGLEAHANSVSIRFSERLS